MVQVRLQLWVPKLNVTSHMFPPSIIGDSTCIEPSRSLHFLVHHRLHLPVARDRFEDITSGTSGVASSSAASHRV